MAKPLHEMLTQLPHSESAPPLYYVLLWFWSRLAGMDEVGLRSLSALAGTLFIPVAYAAGRTLVSHRAGLIVAALSTVSPLLVWYSQEARGYSLLALLGAFSFLFFARALDEPSARTLGWWATASSLCLVTHYFGVFLVGGEALVLLCLHRRRTTWIATAAITGVGLAVLPLAAYQAAFGPSRWITWVSLGLRIEDTLRQLVLPSPPTIWAGAGVSEEHARAWWPLAVVILFAAVGVAVTLGSARQRRGALVALGVGMATAGTPLVLALIAALVTGGKGDVWPAPERAGRCRALS